MTSRLALAQDIYVEQSVEMPSMGGQAPAPMVVKIWFTPDKIRIDQAIAGGMTVIIRSDLGKMWVVNDAAKTYAERSLEAAKAAAADAAAMMGAEKMKVDLKATDNTKKIGDWNCKQYTVSVEGGLPITMEIWATTDVKVDPALYTKMSELMGNPMMNPLIEKIKSIPGYPVQTVMKAKAGGQALETVSTVRKISQEKIDPAVFDLPAGFTKAEAPGSPPGAAPAPAPKPADPQRPAPKKGSS